jgi:plasmid stabilization system protein ParE
MSRAIRWTNAASADLDRIVEYIAADSPIAAQRFREGVISTVDLLRGTPYLGERLPRRRGIRRLLYGRHVILLCRAP